jgi:hypothetical protein
LIRKKATTKLAEQIFDTFDKKSSTDFDVLKTDTIAKIELIGTARMISV